MVTERGVEDVDPEAMGVGAFCATGVGAIELARGAGAAD